MKSKRQSKQSQHDAHNREAAQIILDSVEAHGGEQSASVQWARAIEAKAGKGPKQESPCAS
jgi:hypothetical protein